MSSLEYDLFLYLNVLFKQCELNLTEIRKLIFENYNSRFNTKSTIDSNESDKELYYKLEN